MNKFKFTSFFNCFPMTYLPLHYEVTKTGRYTELCFSVIIVNAKPEAGRSFLPFISEIP